MTRQRRLTEILDLLSERGHLDVEDITSHFDVSPITARRDLNVLAAEKLVTRTHGGATVLGTAYELPLQYRIARNVEGKLAIARAASELVAPGQRIGLTGGTTTTEIARELARSTRLQPADDQRRLTIVTNALNIGYEMAIRPHIEILVTGGVARARSFELVGPTAVASLHGLALDAAFIGVDAIDARAGAATSDQGESEVNRTLASLARTVVVVADATKFSAKALWTTLDLERIDVLITDDEPPRPLRAALDYAGARVVVTGQGPGHTG